MQEVRSVRTYTIQFARPMGTMTAPCDEFLQFVRKVTYNGREVLFFNAVNNGGDCRVNLKIKCFSYGKMGPERLTRSVQLKFEDVEVVHVVRENSSK